MAKPIWYVAYNGLGVPLMWLALRVGALVNEKAREAWEGRRGWKASLDAQLARPRDEGETPTETIWFHAPSVGEFEQAKPLIRALYPDYRIVTTCFSPSVIGAMERYPFQDAALFLPLDSRRNVRHLFDRIEPKALVFSKFDVWPNCVWEAARRNVPVGLIAGTLHATSKRLRPGGKRLFRHLHGQMRVQCAVSEGDAERLRRLSPPNSRIVVTGDTRFDTVFARAESPPDRPILPDEEWGDVFRLVAGSTYVDEERVLIPAFVRLRERCPNARMILVPHEPTDAHLAASEALLERAGLRSVRLSDVERGERIRDADVVLVDRVGFLAHLYRYGTVAFVGGGFHARVHNVMEPAVLEKPVLFGPMMDNSPEAYGLLDRDAAYRARDGEELAERLIALAEDPDRVRAMGAAGRAYILENLGASERTLAAIREALLSG